MSVKCLIKGRLQDVFHMPGIPQKKRRMRRLMILQGGKRMEIYHSNMRCLDYGLIHYELIPTRP
jgi:hypothetical protein